MDEYYFGHRAGVQDAFWRYHRNTNYSVVDSDVIRDLYQRSYDEQVRGSRRLHFRNLTRVAEVKRAGSGTRVVPRSLLDDRRRELAVDALVFATGYDGLDPSHLLGDFDRHFARDAAGRHRVERDYRLVSTSGLTCGVYLQGGTEHSHGPDVVAAVRTSRCAAVRSPTDRACGAPSGELGRARPVEAAPSTA
ncbi:SidA/IucD/PvdA family monooxygenase [Streptomyces sp. KL116D]|uniref:SidA/IucD/PvdA family monooxygenase n=1 Tax=Streptomyces sp. KL116D TaxID=3045152 RepID=UPI0035563230